MCSEKDQRDKALLAIRKELALSLQDLENGNTLDAREALNEIRKKYGLIEGGTDDYGRNQAKA